MKNLLNLKNAKILSKKEQKSINGGNLDLCIDSCGPNAYPSTCGANQECTQFWCFGAKGSEPVYYCVGLGPGNP